MDIYRFMHSAAAVAAIVSGAAAFAAEPTVVPAEPLEFEHVHWRATVDDCMFNEQSVTVEQRDGVLAIRHQPNLCFAPGEPEVVDIHLGAFALGSYRVDFYDGAAERPSASRQFQVRRPVQIAVFPPPPRPIADYTGLWGTDGEPGWGLSLTQGATSSLFGALFVFDTQRQPQWYTLQGGGWDSSTLWSGKVVRSDGPPWSRDYGASADANYVVVGAASLDFRMKPGTEGVATLTYTIDGQRVSKSITRARL